MVIDAQSWILHDPDPSTADELRRLSDEELQNRFCHPLRFGTAGLRGPMRGGPDSMNLAVVLRASWAIAQYLLLQGHQGKTIIVGRDGRYHSDRFAQAAAEVFHSAGFHVIALPEPLPTPVVGFAVRHVQGILGVQITASHNPSCDNGYKVYDQDGAQIIHPCDQHIEQLIAQAPFADCIPRKPLGVSGYDIIENYIAHTAHLAQPGKKSIRIAFSALHGVGGKLCSLILTRAGFDDIHPVMSQYLPDPAFPTVDFPNPEEPGSTDQLLMLAQHVDADIAIAFDPDADRCAVGIPTPQGWTMLTGNETGWLLGDYVLRSLPMWQRSHSLVATTYVSSGMLKAIAEHYQVGYQETPTGFKWLARADQSQPGHHLVYAYEEALGYCVDPDHVRDKDGLSAAVMICTLVAQLKDHNDCLYGRLEELAQRFGRYHTVTVTQRYADSQMAEHVMEQLRRNPPTHLGVIECHSMVVGDLVIVSGRSYDVDIRVVLRRSGTEPKLKCYVEFHRASHALNETSACISESLIAEILGCVESFLDRQ